MKNSTQAGQRPRVTIASGQPYSTPIDNGGVGLRGLAVLFDGAWTAARLALQVKDENGNWFFLRDDELNLVTLANIPTTGNASLVSFPGEAWQVGAWRIFRLVSINTASEVLVNQNADRSLVVSMVY